MSLRPSTNTRAPSSARRSITYPAHPYSASTRAAGRAAVRWSTLATGRPASATAASVDRTRGPSVIAMATIVTTASPTSSILRLRAVAADRRRSRRGRRASRPSARTGRAHTAAMGSLRSETRLIATAPSASTAIQPGTAATTPTPASPRMRSNRPMCAPSWKSGDCHSAMLARPQSPGSM